MSKLIVVIYVVSVMSCLALLFIGIGKNVDEYHNPNPTMRTAIFINKDGRMFTRNVVKMPESTIVSIDNIREYKLTEYKDFLLPVYREVYAGFWCDVCGEVEFDYE